MKRILVLAIAAAAIAGCTRGDPGPLAGSWRVMGPNRVTMHFRPGEMEAEGVTNKVTYEQVGMDVVVTYETGEMKGKSMRFTMTGPNTATSELGNLSRRTR